MMQTNIVAQNKKKPSQTYCDVVLRISYNGSRCFLCLRDLKNAHEIKWTNKIGCYKLREINIILSVVFRYSKSKEHHVYYNKRLPYSK